MRRLLHAAARGARIQTYGSEYREYGDSHSWAEITRISLEEFDHNYYRIHPDDEHLQYGPISTLLREMALTNDCDGADIPYIRITLLTEEGYWKSTEDQQCVFLLILAEALADEGM
jgi:hypothetical protein